MTRATAVSARSAVAEDTPPPRTGALSAGALFVAALVAVVLLGASGGLRPLAVFDPGVVVRYGLPALRAVHDLAAAVTIGLLAVGTWVVTPSREASRASLLGATRRRLIGAAARWGVLWLAAGLAVLVLTAADVSGVRVGSPGFLGVLLSFVGQVDLGRSLGVSILLVGLATALAATATRITTAAWASVLSVVALLPLALAGHAAGTRDHMNSVDSLAIHLIGACLWVGGLAALLISARSLGGQLPTAVARYSRLAGWCLVAVGLSGVLNAVLRLGTLRGLASGYGLLIVAKALALVVLGVAGLIHRRLTIGQLTERPRLFIRLATVEVVIMAATMGLAVALSRSVPPPTTDVVDPVSALLGFPVPPPLTRTTYLTQFYPDVLWLTVAGLLALGYVLGVRRLRRRGDSWPVSRMISWVGGCALLVVMTSGGPGIYGRMHFSTHMLQHMVLMTGVPMLWVLGAPVTLALRALTARTDGSLGAREALLSVVHSRAIRLLGHPIMATAFFFGSLIAFYYTRLFHAALFTHTGHVLMVVHFLGVGYLLIWCMIGIDPGPGRPAYPFRLLMLLIMLGVHSFFGISLMASGTVLAPDWWHALGQTDDAALLLDQQRGGGIAWAAGDLPSLLLGVALVVNWVRDDTRRARQIDRKADRDGDAELRAYNERLAALSRHDRNR